MILTSSTAGSYYITPDKKKNLSKILSSFRNIVGVNIRKYTLGKGVAVLLIGTPSNDKESWKLLASLMRGIGIQFEKQTISSYVMYDHKQLTEKDSTWIKNESKKISKLVNESKEGMKSVSHTPRISTTHKIAIMLIGVIISISVVEYPVLAMEYYHSAAHQALVEGRFEEALLYTQKVLEINPNNEEALQREMQIQFLSSVLTNDSDRFKTAKELNDMADKFVEIRSYHGAFGFYYLSNLKDKTNTRALNGVGDALYNINDKNFEQAYSKKEFNLEKISRFDVAKEYHNDVIEIYEVEQDLFNGYASALNGLGNIYTTLRDFNSATKYYDTVLKIINLDSPEFDSSDAKKEAKIWLTNAQLGKGLLYLNQLNYDKAIQSFQKANQIENNTKTLNALGDVYFRKNVLKQSAEFYEKSLWINNKTNVDAFTGMGFVHYRSGNIMEAEKSFQKAQLINDKIVNESVDYANLLFENGDYNTAEYAYRAILDIDGYNDMALMGLGNKLMIDGNVDEAVKVYDKALQINPDQAESLLTQVESLLSSGGRYDNAQRLCGIILEYNTNNTNILQLLEENCPKQITK